MAFDSRTYVRYVSWAGFTPARNSLVAMHADAWSAVGSIGSAVVLLGAVFYASKQVKEARTLREEQARPWIFVSFEVTAGVLISLVI